MYITCFVIFTCARVFKAQVISFFGIIIDFGVFVIDIWVENLQE